MECGAQEALCHVLTWLTENELAARKINDALVRIGEGTTGTAALVIDFLRAYGATLVGLLGALFGIWKTWMYHDRLLHERLAKYISARDGRLRDVRSQALETVQRPAPGQSFHAPSFINRDLASVLRERRWDNSALALTVNQSAEWQLSRAVEGIQRRLQLAERETVTLRQELCTAYSLRGAVAASSSMSESHKLALNHFRNALSLPGNADDIQLKELEAHQLRKLGETDEARKAYFRVLRLSRHLESDRERWPIQSRAKRFIAELEPSNKNAFDIITAPLSGGRHSPGAIALLEQCFPMTAWELLEKADMHYFAASRANQLRFVRAEPMQLRDADRCYEAALLEAGKKRWQIGKSTSRLRRLIREGRERVERARSGGIYDTAWLPPALAQLNQPQKPTAEVSSSGSDQPIPEAT